MLPPCAGHQSITIQRPCVAVETAFRNIVRPVAVIDVRAIRRFETVPAQPQVVPARPLAAFAQH
eukprot:6866102-Lingulodinium_polyedra.AAC.1